MCYPPDLQRTRYGKSGVILTNEQKKYVQCFKGAGEHKRRATQFVAILPLFIIFF